MSTLVLAAICAAATTLLFVSQASGPFSWMRAGVAKLVCQSPQKRERLIRSGIAPKKCPAECFECVGVWSGALWLTLGLTAPTLVQYASVIAMTVMMVMGSRMAATSDRVIMLCICQV